MAMRKTSGISRWIIVTFAFSLAFFHLYTGYMGIFENRIQRGVHLLFVVPLAFLLYPMTRKSPRDRIPWYDWALALFSALPSLYIILYRELLNGRWENATPVTGIQLVLGVIAFVTLLEAVRRAASPALAVLMFLAMAELLFGHLLTGTFSHRKYDFGRVIEITYLLQDEGIYGYVTGVSAVFVSLFVVFGAFINSMGLGQYFINLAFKIAGKSAGGPAKVAVISSGLFGTISGSATANVFATGIFTIPLMKRLGYKPTFAGAVEATASTGGGLVPPVMGAAIFLMAQLTQIPYISICKYALPSAILFYLCVYLTVHYEAKKHRLQVLDESTLEILPWKDLLKDSYLLLPIGALLFFLLRGYSPMKGAFYGIVACIFVSQVNAAQRMGIRGFIDTLVSAGMNIVMIGCACAAAGFIVGVITNTGIGLSFSSLVMNLAQGNTFIALFLVMCSTTILGMGLPTTAAYVLTIAVGAPILVELGGDILAIHLFVFYFAILASVTPPVAMAAYAGASVAGAPPMRTAFEATRLAFAGYIVPYLFFYNRGVLLQGDLQYVVVCLAIAVIGVFLAVYALGGWMLAKIYWPERLLLLFLAIFVPFPIYLSNVQSLVLGVTSLVVLYIVQKKRAGKEPVSLETSQ